MLKPFYNKKKNIDDHLLPAFSDDDVGLFLMIGDNGQVEPYDIMADTVGAEGSNILTGYNEGTFTSSKIIQEFRSLSGNYSPYPVFVIRLSTEQTLSLTQDGTLDISFASAPAGYVIPLNQYCIVHIYAKVYSQTLNITLLPNSEQSTDRILYLSGYEPLFSDGIYSFLTLYNISNNVLTLRILKID